MEFNVKSLNWIRLVFMSVFLFIGFYFLLISLGERTAIGVLFLVGAISIGQDYNRDKIIERVKEALNDI